MAEVVVRTVGEMLQVTAPALLEILTAAELGAMRIRVLRQPGGASMLTLADWPEVSVNDVLDDGTLLEFRTVDDWGGSWMQGRETAIEMYERFRSELQDYVAESKFGWGQWRP